MPKAMNSKPMFRLGLVLSILGCANAMMGNPISLWYAEKYHVGWEYIGQLTGALQQVLLVGGLFLVLGSLVVRHFEILTLEFRAAAESAAFRREET